MILALDRRELFCFGGRWSLYRVNKKYRKAIKILIAVVIGALVLAGLYVLFSNTVLPTLTKRIEDMFDYAG